MAIKKNIKYNILFLKKKKKNTRLRLTKYKDKFRSEIEKKKQIK